MAINYEFERQIIAAAQEGNMEAVEKLAALRRHVERTLQELGVTQLPLEKLPAEQLRTLYPEARLVQIQSAIAIQDHLDLKDYLKIHTDSNATFNLTAFTRSTANETGILTRPQSVITMLSRDVNIAYIATDGSITEVEFGVPSSLYDRSPKRITHLGISDATYLAWTEIPKRENGYYDRENAKYFLQTSLHAIDLRRLTRMLTPWRVEIKPSIGARSIEKRRS